jgi:hypothetical protein
MDLLAAAAARQQILESFMEEHPEEVLRVAIPSDLRAAMPTTVQPYIEEEVKLTGEIEIVSRCHGTMHSLSYVLNTGEERLTLHFAGPQPTNLQSGSYFHGSGIRVNDSVALRWKGKTIAPMTAAALSNLGEQKVAVLLVNFRNNTTTPYAVNDARNLVFTSVNNFIKENSQQQTWLSGDAFGWYTIDFDASVCNPFQIRDNAHAAATAAGVNLSMYNRYIYVFPYVACIGVPGSGSVGGNPSRMWVNGSLDLRTVAHEFGHNLGLFHSFALDCGASAIGSNCTKIEYGDTLDIMGYPGVIGHYNAPQKERLGWMSNTIATVTTNGSYVLAPYEGSANANPQALKILKSTDASTGKKTWYYVEYRQPLGFDSALSSNTNVRNGVVIHVGSEDPTVPTYLLDMTPETASWLDPALVVGKSFFDPEAGVTISTLWANSTGAAVSVSLGASAPACVHQDPTVTITPTQSQWVKAGAAVPYTVSVKNNDAANCSTSTFSLQKSLPNNSWTGVFASPGLAIQPGATVSTNLTVTSPASAADGVYSINITTANAAAASSALVGDGLDAVTASLATTVSTTATYIISSALDMTVTTDQPSYPRRAWISITANVLSAGQPVAKANVTFTITKPNGKILQTTRATGTSGDVLYRFSLPVNDPLGVYQVSVKAAKGNLKFGPATTSFTMTP